ncbi:hypothetical protein ACWGH8_08985 [Nonomuraea muscovyensis]
MPADIPAPARRLSGGRPSDGRLSDGRLSGRRFGGGRWERRYRRVVDEAFRRVPFYRDQWVAAGRALDRPEPTASADLAGQLHRLCPFARPFDPSEEPSPWIGDARLLRDALALAGAPRRVPVLEVRAAVLDRRTLGRFPWSLPRYGVLLAPDAKVVDAGRRRSLNAEALRLAARAGRAVLVGDRAAVEAVLPDLDGVEVVTVPRVTAGEAAGAAEAVLAHDPHLGYFAANDPGCGGLHLLWRHFHARAAGRGPALTALRGTRPALVDVVPHGAEGLAPDLCPRHGTPVLVPGHTLIVDTTH